jgi:hypothetical protein
VAVSVLHKTSNMIKINEQYTLNQIESTGK